MFTIGDTLEIQRYKYIESKITEKDKSCKRIHQEDITIIDIYACNSKAPQYKSKTDRTEKQFKYNSCKF